MKKAKLFFSTLFVLLTVAVSAQNMRVSGSVKDSSTGEGIPFASVVVKGTMIGTSTDVNGNYQLNAPANGTLEFTAVGYVLVDEAVGGRAVINISLDPDSESLDESIVVAYGTAKKSSFTGSAGTVKSESLQKRTVSNVTKGHRRYGRRRHHDVRFRPAGRRSFHPDPRYRLHQRFQQPAVCRGRHPLRRQHLLHQPE